MVFVSGERGGGWDKMVGDGLVSGWAQLELSGSAGRRRGAEKDMVLAGACGRMLLARSLLPLE